MGFDAQPVGNIALDKARSFANITFTRTQNLIAPKLLFNNEKIHELGTYTIDRSAGP